jgi:hypothetical protein
MRHDEHGYDAPYALKIFGLLALVSAIGAAMAVPWERRQFGLSI